MIFLCSSTWCLKCETEVRYMNYRIHLIQIVFVKPHDKSNSLLSYLVVAFFFCMWSHYTAMPPHTPPPRHILIIRQSPPITPLYNAWDVRSYRRCLLSQQHLLRHLIGLLGCDFLVSFTIENYPTRRQVRFLDYYKWRSTFCCFFWTQSPLCRWFDTHFSASTFISSSGCCCLGDIEG